MGKRIVSGPGSPQIERDRESGGIDLTEYRREVGEIGLLTMLDLKTGGTPEDMEVEQ